MDTYQTSFVEYRNTLDQIEMLKEELENAKTKSLETELFLDYYSFLIAPDEPRPEPTLQNINECPNCHIPFEYDDFEDDTVTIEYCSGCNATHMSSKAQYSLSYESETKIVQPYRYKRITHLRERMLNCFALKMVNFPDTIQEDIVKELEKQSLAPSHITLEWVEGVMKLYGYNQYVKYATYLYKNIGGHFEHSVDLPLQQKIELMFHQVEDCFLEIRNTAINPLQKTRKSLFSYPYILKQILLLLDRPELAQYFKLLKNNKKVREFDEIWEKICERMEWKFHAIVL
jgi:hypothetical protein